MTVQEKGHYPFLLIEDLLKASQQFLRIHF